MFFQLCENFLFAFWEEEEKEDGSPRGATRKGKSSGIGVALRFARHDDDNYKNAAFHFWGAPLIFLLRLREATTTRIIINGRRDDATSTRHSHTALGTYVRRMWVVHGPAREQVIRTPHVSA